MTDGRHHLKFDEAEWESPIPGMRQKVLRRDGLRVRLVEYTGEMEPHWCERGHAGYIIEGMLDDVTAVEPTDEKGRAIVPQWEDEYRRYIAARRDYADDLRRTGDNLAFYEPAESGLPISERLETFAGDNDMPACAPPRDLTR